MIVLKWIEILLKVLNVWGGLKKLRETPDPWDRRALNLSPSEVDLRKEKWRDIIPSPLKIGLLFMKNNHLSVTGSHAFFSPETVWFHP
jgi:hypothetical protein